MKLIGFIKEHDNLSCAKSIDDLITKRVLEPQLVSKVVQYLNGNSLILGWMGYSYDVKNKNIICPDSYFSDGVFIWPGYLSYYIETYPGFILEDDFISYLKNKNFEISKLNKNRILELENILDVHLENKTC